MKQSVELTEESIAEALTMLGTELRRRLTEEGRESFVNSNETLGATEVNVSWLRHAVLVKKYPLIVSKLLDIGVDCVLGVASMRSPAPDNTEDTQGEKA